MIIEIKERGILRIVVCALGCVSLLAVAAVVWLAIRVNEFDSSLAYHVQKNAAAMEQWDKIREVAVRYMEIEEKAREAREPLEKQISKIQSDVTEVTRGRVFTNLELKKASDHWDREFNSLSLRIGEVEAWKRRQPPAAQ